MPLSSHSDEAGGYVSPAFRVWYRLAGRLDDLLTWWCFLPLGGEASCRRRFAGWLSAEPGEDVLSLCCGTGSTERVLAQSMPGLEIIQRYTTRPEWIEGILAKPAGGHGASAR